MTERACRRGHVGHGRVGQDGKWRCKECERQRNRDRRRRSRKLDVGAAEDLPVLVLGLLRRLVVGLDGKPG